MGIKVELVPADKTGEILERALKIRNPELWQTRRKNRAKARAQARRSGEPLPRLTWKPHKRLTRGLFNPMESLGLADLNRPFSEPRMELYVEEMLAGRWQFSPDPIVISEQGYVINGQHRLVAADAIEWEEGDEIPLFLVVWGVDKKTALLMDEAQRSSRDRRQIAFGYAQAA
jgi:hypothetical protein